MTHGIAPERLAQIGDEVLKRADRRLRRLPGPELFDEPVRGDDLAGMKQQQRQEGALLSPFQLERAPLHQDLERAEDAELDSCTAPGFTTVKRWFLASV